MTIAPGANHKGFVLRELVPGLCGAERAHRPNNAQVLCLGGRVVGPNVAVLLVEHWLGAEFAGGRSAPKARNLTRSTLSAMRPIAGSGRLCRRNDPSTSTGRRVGASSGS